MHSSEAETVALPLPADTLTQVTALSGTAGSTLAEGLAPENTSPTSPPRRLSAQDTHRLALQAKLTELGVPPAPGDRRALTQLSALDSKLISTVLNWLTCAAGPVQADDPDQTNSRAPRPARPVPAPERHEDPRLLSW